VTSSERLHSGISVAPHAPPRPARILYAAGEGDIIGTFQHWKKHEDDPSQLSVTYSGQFFDLCQRLGYDGYVLVHADRRGTERDDRFVIRQRRLPRFRNGPGILYHAEQMLAALRIVLLALRTRADVVVVASGASHWFPLATLRMFRIKIVPALHCVLWPKYHRPGILSRIIRRLDGWFFSHYASAILTASGDIEEQLTELTCQQPLHGFPFMPTYRPSSFPPSVEAPPAPPFRVLYAGRIEAAKGVFDLLSAARSLAQLNIEFDICGDGSALTELKRQAADAGLADRFRCHGHCDRPTMVRMFRQCHTVVVPTRTEFVEGFNQVVAEGILAGRPVVSSSVCPAVQYLGDAVIRVPPDDAAGYAGAIRRLAEDHGHYERCRERSSQAQAPFFDADRGWGAALEAALKQTIPNLFRNVQSA